MTTWNHKSMSTKEKIMGPEPELGHCKMKEKQKDCEGLTSVVEGK